MKRRLALIIGILGLAVSALAFTGSDSAAESSLCPLRGTPACPEYPSCCK